MKPKSIVLLSAGLDSTVNLFMAMIHTDVVQAVTFDYGQRAADKEISRSAQLCDHLKVAHNVIHLPFVKDFGKSALLTNEVNVPQGDHVKIDDKKTSINTMKSVWVPNRNGIFLNIAAGIAESQNAKYIVPGFNKEEAETFPDNSYDYLRIMRKAFMYSTLSEVDVQCYTITLDKNEIVEKAKNLNIPFELLWPCYLAEDKWCGQCESCLRSKRAFESNNIDMKKYFNR